MMLSMIRVASVLMALLVGYTVLTGSMSLRIFIVPDLVLSAALIVAAAMPAAVAPRALLGANGFAAGVFTVATSRYVIEDGWINPPLVVLLVLAWLFTLLLIATGPRVAANSPEHGVAGRG